MSRRGWRLKPLTPSPARKAAMRIGLADCSPKGRGDSPLPGAASACAEALDLASFRRRDVVRTAPHLAHEPLLLHLAAELPKRLLELLGIFDDYSHNLRRIPVGGWRCSVKPASLTTRGRRGE